MKLYNILCTPFMKCVCLRVFCVVQNLCCFVVFQNNPVAGCVLLRGSSPIVLLPRTQFLLRLTCLSQPPRFPILTIQTFSGLLLQIPFVLLFQSFGQPCHFQFQSIRHVFFFVLFQIVSFPQSLFQQIFGLFRFERYFLSPPCFRFTQGTVC
jgi:hypothetical protein